MNVSANSYFGLLRHPIQRHPRCVFDGGAVSAALFLRCPMRYGSVCSGISAASVAWRPLGWRAAWFAEIEPFPCAVLAHHYPDVPNLGDMTKIARAVLAGTVEAPDVLEGGTPCQSYSIAGLRASLDDARGNLTLKFVELADAIDHVRISAGKPPCIITWENVPGVLTTKDNAFGCFLAGLAGEDEPLVAPGKGWSNAGCVYGPKRAIAWRTLDAEYFGVAQRRRRVFVVASARKDFDPATILFEWDGVRRDSPPSREARQDVAGTLAASLGGADENDAADGRLVASTGDVSHCLNAGGMGRQDYETEALITQPARTVALRGREGGATAELGDEVAGCLRASTGGGDKPHVLFKNGELNASTYEADASSILRTLRATVGEEKVAEWFIGILDSLQSPEVLRSWLHGESIRSSSGDFRSFVGNFPLPRQEGLPAGTLREVWENGPDGCTPQGRGLAKQLAFEFGEGLPELSSSGAFGTEVLHRLRSKAEGARVLRKTLSTLQEMGRPPYDESQSAQPTMQVRRLTPKECARLQAFPDDYLSSVRVGGKPPADGPMYKSLGNSMCVNVMRWIGIRIQLADPIRAAREAIEQ